MYSLTGCVPTEVFECTKLEKLNLSRNQLTGSIPSGLEMLKNLKTLDLGNNSLSGDIPTEICQLTKVCCLFAFVLFSFSFSAKVHVPTKQPLIMGVLSTAYAGCVERQ